MATSKHEDWFVEKVAERAQIPRSDVPSLVDDFLRALGSFADQSGWKAVVDAVPLDTELRWNNLDREEVSTLDDFFLAMSDEESVGDGRAAEHARAVAQTVAEHAGPGGQERIRKAVKHEGMLALFETMRGEVTSADAPTEGESQRREDL
jgi:uncharacterized protein (DUF2267 family)